MIKVIRLQVYLNTLRNWVSLDTNKCVVKPILFVTSANISQGDVPIDIAQRLGWEIFQTSKISENGIPFVKHMYMDVAKGVPNCSYYAYSNGDILYSHGLIDTLRAVSEV